MAAKKTCTSCGQKCTGEKSVCVCGYTRKAGRRRKKKRTTAAGGYECRLPSGYGCGVRHRDYLAAIRHCKTLRRKERARHAYYTAGKSKKRRGKVPEWHPVKRAG